MLPDYLAPNLRVVFVGTAAGERSAELQHYYAGRGNITWHLIFDAGLTPRILRPEEDGSVISFGIGLTDLVKGMAASSDSKLAPSDFDVPGFLEKVRRFEPCSLAFTSLTAAKVVARHLGEPKPTLGPLDFLVAGLPAHALPSGSGANQSRRNVRPKDSREEWWREFGRWIRDAC